MMLVFGSWAAPSAGPAHGGVSESVWTAWNVDPAVLIPAGLVAFWYLRGLRRLRNRHRHQRWQTAVFFAGLAAVVLAIESPVDRLGEHHFTFHMVQHELLLLVGAPLMLLGAPIMPMLLGLPRRVRRRVVWPIARSRLSQRWYRAFTWPPASTGLLIAVLYSWHLMPGWYDAALRSDLIHGLQHASFLAVGFVFWLPVIDPLPFHSRLSYLQRLIYQAPMIVARIALGLILAMAEEPSYRAYAEVEPVFSALTGMTDQEYGVVVMWMFGFGAHIVAAALVFDLLTRGWEQRGPPAPAAAVARDEEQGRRAGEEQGGTHGVHPAPVERDV